MDARHATEVVSEPRAIGKHACATGRRCPVAAQPLGYMVTALLQRQQLSTRPNEADTTNRPPSDDPRTPSQLPLPDECGGRDHDGARLRRHRDGIEVFTATIKARAV